MINNADGLSIRAKLLMVLRENTGKQISGVFLARNLSVSRVAIWKNVQTLCAAGYAIRSGDSGYMLETKKENSDFLYPWEFGLLEQNVSYFDSMGSTMDKAREFAVKGKKPGTVVIAERQAQGRGRNGRLWSSRPGGLFCTFIEKSSGIHSGTALVDYYLSSMLYQIAAARAVSVLCGKPAQIRWPNDIYIGGRKIAGVMTELEGKGDAVSWLTVGIGVNVNNQPPSSRSVNCAGITGRPLSRRELLLAIIDEAGRLKKRAADGMVYAQGNRTLAAEWNALADSIGAKVTVMQSVDGQEDPNGRVLTKGIFRGVDPAGRCIIRPESGNQSLYFNPGPVSLMFF